MKCLLSSRKRKQGWLPHCQIVRRRTDRALCRIDAALFAALLFAALCTSCDKMLCDDYDFINESGFYIEYRMSKIDDTDTIKAHESYTRYLSRNLGIEITNSVPVQCIETSTSATFREYTKYTYTITNKCAFTVTLGTDNSFDKNFTVPGTNASVRPSVVELYSKVLSIQDPPGGVAALTVTWSGNNATVTINSVSGV